MHMTGGACEISQCEIDSKQIQGTLERKWDYPIVVTAGFPDASGGITIAQTTVPLSESRFAIVP